MGRPFITLWSQPQLAFERKCLPNRVLEHSASNQYRSAGVQRGDRVYILATRAGAVLLLGRIQVERVVTRATAQRLLSQRNLYEATDHVIGKGTAFGPDRTVPQDVVRAVKRASGRPVKIDPNAYRVDTQTLRRTGRIEEDSARLLDELLDPVMAIDPALLVPEAYAEGTRHLVLQERVERRSTVRQRALELHGANCQACGFSFEQRYGALGAGFAEVHHLRPLKLANGTVMVDPAKDVAVVCANCHRMLHRNADPPRTVAALQRIVVRRERATAG